MAMNFFQYIFENDQKDPNEGAPDQNDTPIEDVEEGYDIEFPADTSGFEEENNDELGDLKVEQPNSEGLDAAISGADQFVDSTDGQAPEIDISFHDAFPKDDSGFEEDADLSVDFVDADYIGDADPSTAPSYEDEKEVFTKEEPEAEVIGSENITSDFEEEPSDVELSDDSDMNTELEESFTGWDDLI